MLFGDFSIWQNVDTTSLNGIPTLIGNILSLLLFGAGALAIIYVLIGAFQYVVSAGNPAEVAKAKNTIVFAIVGLVIVMLALVIVQFVRGLFK
jgi:tellurite resistance protein TehA-like permease